MSETLGKCPSCDTPGAVGAPCEGKACKKRGYHFIPEEFWDRAHLGADPNPDPVIGLVIGDFLVVDVLGAGGFGKVFLALQAPLFRLRGALKLLEFPNDNREFQQALLEKFQGEAEVLAELSHPNIVRLIKYGTHRKRPYLVMEFLEKGHTLRDEIFRRARAKRAFSQDELRHIFEQLLNGLEAAHAQKIIHRDLKPENIMLQRVVGNPFHVRILDFGIAKFVEGQGTTKWPLGSPSYMAPEQVGLQNLGTWTDLYALGVMFFEMVTGRRPFPGNSDEAIMAKKLKADFDPFEQVADLAIPQETVAFMRRALAKEPEDRHQTVAEFRHDCSAGLDALEGQTGAMGPGGRELTFLLESKDVVEVDQSSAPTRRGESAPPQLPESDEPAEPKASAGLGRVAFAGVVAGLLALGAFYMHSTLGAPGDAQALDEKAPTEPVAVEDVDSDSAEEDADDESVSEATTITVDAAARLVHEAAAAATRADRDVADELPALAADAVVGLTAGKFHTCALRQDGELRCWGANFEGELGLGHTRKLGDNEAVGFVDPVDLGRPVRQLVAAGDRGASFTCALVGVGDVGEGDGGGGRMRCWGANAHGQLGYGHTRRIGDDEPLATLGDVALGRPVTQIAAGASQFGSHACALLDDDSLRCWGSAKFGKLGYGHTNVIGDDELPSSVGAVAVGGPVARVAAGKYNTCAIFEDEAGRDGRLRCWGWNAHGQLGLGHTDDVGDDEIPASVEPIDLGAPVVQVAVGRRHICAVLGAGEEEGEEIKEETKEETKQVRCWGWNNRGQLGLGHTDDVGDDETPASVEPVRLSGEPAQVAVGALHSCALLDDGNVQCWGDNRFGQLGYGHTNPIGDKAAPFTVGTVYLGAPAVAIAAGSYHTCALLEPELGPNAQRRDRQVRCWGHNDHGQLGYGHTNHIGDDEPPGGVADVVLD